MKNKQLIKAAALAVTLTTIAGIPATPFTSTASAAITLNAGDFDTKAVEVLEASIEALGGREKLSEVKFVKQTGTISIPAAGLEGTIELNIASPDKLMLVVDFPMMGKTLQGLNDGIMWSSDMMNGPRITPDEEAKDIIKQADLQATLDYKKYNKTIEYVEETEFDGQAAHKIRLVDHDDSESFEFYAVDTGLQIGSETEAVTPMGKIKAITIIQDYKEIAGFLQPTKVIQKAGATDIHFAFISADYSEIDDSVFELPAAIKALIKATADKEKAAP